MKEYIVQAMAQETIDSFDAHNAPELIRCKDCKHAAPDMECGHPNETLNPLSRNDGNPDFFCADGERK